MKNYKIGEHKLNEARSITKISKELASVTSKMKDLADEFYSKPEEERAEEIKNELRELTPKKKALIAELDASVAGKDRNVELIIQEKSDRELFYNHINEELRSSAPQQKDFRIKWLKDWPELADILNKDVSKLWKKHKLDDKKHNRPKDSKWGPSKWGASYTFRKGRNRKDYRDTTELQWSRAEGFNQVAGDDEKGGYEHILKFTRDVVELLNKNGYKVKYGPTGGPYRHDHLVIWHNKDVDESLVNENDKYVVIDPKGNPGPATVKVQAFQHAKKKGGNKKGFFVVLAKNARKAQKLVGKHGGNLPEKAQDKMFDMMYEGYKSNIKKKWDSTDAMLDDLREFILDAKDSGGEDLVRDIHNALRLMTNYAEGELKAFESSIVERNAFLGARAKAIEEDAEEFEFNGKIYPVVKSKKITHPWEPTNEKLDFDEVLYKMDKWLPEDPDAMERYYEILNQEGWKEMQEFFIEYGNEDVLQSYGLTSKDMKKLAKAAMESTVHSGDKLNERVSDKVHIEVIKGALEGWEDWEDSSRLEPIEIFMENIPLEYDVTEDQIDTILDNAMGLRYENLIDFAQNAIYKDIKTAAKGLSKYYKPVKENKLSEGRSSVFSLAKGLRPLLKLGSTVSWKTMSEDALLDLSNKFEDIDDEQADNIASHLNMAIENKQDGYAKDATGWLKSFNKACKDALSGKEVGSAFENKLSEARKIQTKRRYTDSHPAESVGKAARIRNKILEAIKDGKMTQDEFDSLVKELSSDHKRWMKRNGKMFNVSEDGISLSKFGQRILNGIKVNESFASFISK